MQRSRKRLIVVPKRSFLVDTNVFISAFKSGRTKTTELFIKLIEDDDIELIDNVILLEEYEKYAERLGPCSQQFFQIIKDNSRSVRPGKEAICKCRPFFNGSEADMIHAATCLQEGAILLTNDKDFDNIRESGIIEVWGISQAILTLL